MDSHETSSSEDIFLKNTVVLKWEGTIEQQTMMSWKTGKDLRQWGPGV